MAGVKSFGELITITILVVLVVLLSFVAPEGLLSGIDPLAGQQKVGHIEPHSEGQFACDTENSAVEQEEGIENSIAHKFSLTAQPTYWEFTAGAVIDAWTFDGAVPGPVLCVNVGDFFEVTLTNKLDVPVSFHVHLKATGNSSFNPVEVAPGAIGTYYFEADQAGTYLYHDLANGNEGLGKGLHGALIVRDGVSDIDHEIVVILGEYQPDYFPGTYAATINGLAFPWLPLWNFEEGEIVQFHLLNAGPSEEHTFHIHGQRWMDIDEGRPIDNKFLSPHSAVYHSQIEVPEGFVGLARALTDDVTVFEVEMESSGEWMYHCHVYDHINAGMMGMMSIEESKHSEG